MTDVVIGASGTVTIPTYRYTSAAFAARELTDLWPRVWQLACTVDQVGTPGAFHEHRIGPLSVLLVRGNDGELRAFQNVCRHRGSALCEGSGTDLDEIRCPFHRWTWDLTGALREVPSRKVFGVRNEDLPLIPVRVDTWGPLVFVNLDVDAGPLTDFLEGIPEDAAWAALEQFRCTAVVTVPARCNWKTLIEAFSETYHVQGIHREMLPMCDDVNGPQRLWHRHGKLEQPYGVPSPRLRDVPDNQRVWEGFVEVMGNRVGLPTSRANAGPAPASSNGTAFRDALAASVRDQNHDAVFDFDALTVDQVLNMHQYNLFPNITVLVFSDMVNIVRSRPGPTVEDALMDVYLLERTKVGDGDARTGPFEAVAAAGEEIPLGLVLEQDIANFERTQRGLHQPGLTHLTVSASEECRIVNLHRNLEEQLGIEPSELGAP